MIRVLTILVLLGISANAWAAIDTREKRQSAFYFRRQGVPGVTPNASKDQEWRQEVRFLYSGILASGAPTPTPLLLRMLQEDFP